MEYFLIAGLLMLLIVREYVSHKERKDLYDRLMSRDISDYKENVDVEPAEDEKELEPDTVDIPDNPLDLDEDVKEEIENYGNQI